MEWQVAGPRDTHSRLTSIQRNVDNVPPTDPVSGWISYGISNRAAGLASSVTASEEEARPGNTRRT